MQTHQTAQADEFSDPAQVIGPLIQDFLRWLTAGPKPYCEVMETWRTSCPRLTVWEDAVDEGLVVRDGALVRLSAEGERRIRV